MGRVIVADREPLFREGIRTLLSSIDDRHGRNTQFQEADTFDDILEAAGRGGAVNGIIVDFMLLNHQGGASFLTLRRRVPEAAIIAFIADDNPVSAQHCLSSGVAACLRRTAPRDAIYAALHDILAGKPTLPEALPNERNSAALTPDRTPPDRIALSSRQSAVLDLVQDGKPNKQIAWELSISETTVKAHMTAILRKLGVNSRAQAIVLLQRQPLQAATRLPLKPLQAQYVSAA